MKKINYLVLMAAMLLVGTNAWAQNTISVVYHNGVTPAASFSDLQTAINSVAPGDSATITLSATQLLNKGIVIPNVMSAASEAEKIVNRAGQRICIDLNGHDIKTSAQTKNSVFSLLKGTLRFTGEGKIERANVAKGSSNWERGAIIVSGTDGRDASLIDAEHPDDRSKQEWSVLYIDEYVEVYSEYNDTYGIGIQELGNTYPSWGTSKDAWGYKTFYTGTTASGSEESAPMWTKNGSKQQYSAFGVKLMIAGTVYGHTRGINVLGSINQTPKDCEGHTKRTKDTYPYYDRNYPYINIMSTADVSCIDQGVKDNGNGGIYAGGWAVLDISGAVHGQTGIQMKAGDLKVLDGNVYSDSPTAANSGNYHGDVAGSGIFIASDKGYAGETSVSIEGDSRVAGAGGSAIVDVVASNTEEPQVSHVAITGGTIEGGDQGAINITTGTSEQTEVYGGSVTGTVTVGVDENGENGTVVNVSTLIPDNEDYHTTTVTDPESGKTTVVISQGSTPEGDPNVAAGHDANSSVKWTGTSEDITADLTLKELEINESTTQTLTIKTGKTLNVGRVVLGVSARIIVEPGAKFIVGESGIVAPSVDNILLQTSADNPAIFLCHPDAKVGRHPKATVEFVTKSFYKAANNYQYERFGIPTWKELESIECNVAGLYTGIRMYKNGVWDDLGFLQKDIPFEKKNAMNVPFATYNLLAFQATAGAEYLFKGELTGNNDAALNTVDEWTPFTNSFTANVDVTEFLEALDGCAHIEGYLYLATPQGNGKYSWKAWDSESDGLTGLKMAPMQAFILHNSDGVEEASVLNYKSMVYDPATGGAGAPRRAKVYDYTAKLSIVVESADGASDQVVIRESPNSRRNAVKYMNDDVNIYAHGVDNTLSIASSDDVENTYFGFSTVEGGSFTIRFTNVSGRQFDFVDIETNERVAVEEGKTYSFSTTANTVADYRFKIVEREGIATSVDAISAEKTTKGVYTIMGQYVGEMNIWNSLPAGVYVVDGEKRVK